MNPDVDLEYEPSSLLPSCSLERIRYCEERYSFIAERPARFPDSYVRHVLSFHGGVPGKRCFKTASGRTRFIGRFLNFLEEDDLRPPYIPTWRYGVNPSKISACEDIRLDYSIGRNNHDSGTHWDRLGIDLFAFAGIDTAGHDCRGMAEFDLLCFDYSGGDHPSIVTWSYHESFEDEQVTEFVADSFDSLLSMLFRCPLSLTAAHEPSESF